MKITGKISIPFSYAAGVAASRFFDGLKNGKILGTKCPSCRRVLVPARSFCADCYVDTSEYITLTSSGTLITWAENADAIGGYDETEIGIIKLDGADTGFVHRIKISDGKNLEIGDRMEAVFKPVSERQGALDDILYFQPIIERERRLNAGAI